MNQTVIFGAQSIALGTYNSIKEIFPECDIPCFLVTKPEENPSALGSVPVAELREFAGRYSQEEKDSIQVWIATPENVMAEIEEELERFGFHNHVRVNSERWANLQKSAFVKNGEFMPLEIYPVGVHPAKLHIYKAVFYKDKSLQTDRSDSAYVVPLQVGAAGTDVRVADLTDDTGDNISERNGNYSELTGLYWIWKNRMKNQYYGADCYYGLAHYRRFLELSEDDLLRLVDSDVDAVLPYPMPYEPDIGEHHKRYLSDREWQCTLQAIQELQPEYAKAFEGILHQKYLYNYNIILAKSDVLERYCDWLFPILFRIEEINDSLGERKPNRYMGYIGETLETLYFMKNKDRLRIAHTGCRFLV